MERIGIIVDEFYNDDYCSNDTIVKVYRNGSLIKEFYYSDYYGSYNNIVEIFSKIVKVRQGDEFSLSEMIVNEDDYHYREYGLLIISPYCKEMDIRSNISLKIERDCRTQKEIERQEWESLFPEEN